MRVKRIVDSHYPTLSPNDLVTHARALMRDLALSMLPVIDGDKVVGVIKRSHVLMLTSTRSNALVRDLMDTPPLVFRDDEMVSDVIKVMIEFDEWYAPVINSRNNKYIGIVSLASFLRTIHRTLIKEKLGLNLFKIMTKDVEFVLPEDHISKLWRKMSELRISGFPVVRSPKDVRVIGMVTQHDLIRKGHTRIELESESGPRKGVKVRDAMTSPAITLHYTNDVSKALSIMVKKDIGRIPITNDEKKLVGIIDRSDVSKVILELKFMKR